ncbi:MAG: RsfA family transcriptional regulator [Lysinibacillus sp.]
MSRQDAWLQENDELLAEAVIRHVKEGSTQLNAFEEVGDLLNRTAAACGFRWNAVVRKMYEEELAQAKKERKERMRMLQSANRKRMQPVYVMTQPNGAETSLSLSALSLDIVIAYLMKLQHDTPAEQEAQKWQRVASVSMRKIQELEHVIASLERENKEIKEDYEQFVNIMNRARKLVTLDEQEPRSAPVFKMERNGNLVAEPVHENSDLTT